MTKQTYNYCDGTIVCVGDIVTICPVENENAIVTKIILPGSAEAFLWEIPLGGVLLECIKDGYFTGCRYLVNNFDEDHELVSRNSNLCSPYIDSDYGGGDLHGLQVKLNGSSLKKSI